MQRRAPRSPTLRASAAPRGRGAWPRGASGAPLRAPARLAPWISGLALTVLTGCGDQQGPEAPIAPEAMPPGMWTDVRFAPGASDLTEAERERLESLGALGYATALEAPEGPTGVIEARPGRGEGPLLYTSGHGAEATLMADDGTVLHRWAHPFAALPGETAPPHPTQEPWRRVRVLEDGGLLALHDGVGLLRLDAESRLLWWHPGGEHHDLWLDPDGSIWTLTRAPVAVPALGAEPVLDDRLAHLGADGSLLGEWSLLRALLDSRHANLVLRSELEAGDPLHANSLHPVGTALAARVPGANPEQFLVSLRNVSALVTFDPATGSVGAVLQGPFVRQHDARPTVDGHVLLFDNMGAEGRSRALEWDPRAERVAWSWGGPAEQRLLSVFCGAAQRLPGGTTLVTESTAGRAFEVDPSGEVLWRFESPHRTGPDGRLVGVLYEVQRLAAVPRGLQERLQER